MSPLLSRGLYPAPSAPRVSKCRWVPRRLTEGQLAPPWLPGVRPGPQHLPAPTPGRLCFSKPPHLGRVAFSCPWLFRLSRWKVVSWKRPRVTAVNTGYLSLGLCKDRRDPSRACHEFWPRTPALLERGAGRAILSARAGVAAHPRRGCSRADGLGLSADHSLACALGRVIPPQSASDPDDPG